VSVAVRFVAESARSSFTELRVPPRGFPSARSHARRFKQRRRLPAWVATSASDAAGEVLPTPPF
jgi:hypothetical protein